MDAEGHVTGAGSVPGDTVAGYRIIKAIRVRQCAATYRARTPDGSVVMLKTLCRAAAGKAHARMDNEAAVLRWLEPCPHTPLLLETGWCGPQRFLAARWLAGRTLRYIAKHGVAMDRASNAAIESVLAVMLPVVRAFRRLHEHSVAHGDVSRNNILLAAGAVGLVDLESAALLDTPLTAARHRKVTWTYAPPEYAADHPDHDQEWRPTLAGDQYAVAAVLYRQITGRHHRPPRATGVNKDAYEALHRPAIALGGWQAQRWPDLPGVFGTALCTEAEGRFASMRDLEFAIFEALRGDGTTTR